MKNMVDRAFLFALKVHGGQTRKDGKPYITHSFSVAMELAKNGANDELICAGLLHDTIENGGVTSEELKREFGGKVLKLVLFETEDKSLPWAQRKTATLKRLADCDRECAMLVCADKLANIKDIQSCIENGENIWSRFRHGKAEQEWLYRKYATVFSRLSGLKMHDDFKNTVEAVFHGG